LYDQHSSLCSPRRSTAKRPQKKPATFERASVWSAKGEEPTGRNDTSMPVGAPFSYWTDGRTFSANVAATDTQVYAAIQRAQCRRKRMKKEACCWQAGLG
jgi:hypothetical protein